MNPNYNMPLDPIIRGDTLPIELLITEMDGTPINIESDLIFFTLKTDRALADSLATLAAQFTVPVGADAQAGKAVITLTSVQTAAIPPGKYFYDIQWVQPEATPIVKTMFLGTVLVLADTTIDVA